MKTLQQIISKHVPYGTTTDSNGNIVELYHERRAYVVDGETIGHGNLCKQINAGVQIFVMPEANGANRFGTAIGQRMANRIIANGGFIAEVK
jgi:hypothetical protein